MREDLVSTWIQIFFRYFKNYKDFFEIADTFFLSCTKYFLFEKCHGETMMFYRFWFLVYDLWAEYWNPYLCVFLSSPYLRAVPRHYVRNSLLSPKVAYRVLLFLFGLVFLKYNTSIGKIWKYVCFFKGPLPGLKQFLANKSHLKVKKKLHFTLKALFLLKIFKILCWYFRPCRKAV